MEPITKQGQNTSLAKAIQSLLHMQYSSNIHIEEQNFTAVETDRAQYSSWGTLISVTQRDTNAHI